MDDDRNQTSVGLSAEIDEAWPSGFSPSFWMVIGIFVAFALLVPVVMMMSMRRMGPRRHVKAGRRARDADVKAVDSGDGAGGGRPPSGDG